MIDEADITPPMFARKHWGGGGDRFFTNTLLCLSETGQLIPLLLKLKSRLKLKLVSGFLYFSLNPP